MNLIKAVLDFIFDVVRSAATFKWMVKTLWRQATGRLYYFRDCPDWFVFRVANLPVEKTTDDGVRAYCNAAREEMSLRFRLMARDLEAALGEMVLDVLSSKIDDQKTQGAPDGRE